MRAREPDASNARDRGHPLQQRGEITRGVVGRSIVIDDLAEQLDLPATRFGRLLNFGEDVGDRPHAFVSTRVRHDAERAELVAALDDRHPGPHRIGVPDNAKGKRDVLVGVDVDPPAPGLASLCHEGRKALEALRSDDDVDGSAALEERLPFLLGDAAGHGDDR